MKFSDGGGGCDQFLLPENISTYPRIILKETLWNYGQFSNKEMTEWSWALEFSICPFAAFLELHTTKVIQFFLVRLASLEPRRLPLILCNQECLDVLGHVVCPHSSCKKQNVPRSLFPDHPAHLRTPPSSKENTTRNIYSILHETIDCTLFPILFWVFSVIIPTGDSTGFFCLVFWAECFVGVHPWTNVQLFRRSLTLQIGLKSQNVPPTLLKYSVGNYSKGIWHLRYLWKQKNLSPNMPKCFGYINYSEGIWHLRYLWK